ncbi:hypothetical protein PsYK624_149550 [Phanerochaete sordida]|uniref:Uncharacterized protein n=1 Tax=Phanerochaete sordida TaxID=48140 RepID=A0A9P3GNH7_9APHY|nr:hypothetical protein PsYK624_149550 [Phanerochaete sordida]
MDAHATRGEDTVQSFLGYPFDTDETYQQGLAGILGGSGSALDAATRQDVLLRSRVFYYNRITGSSLSVDDVRGHVGEAQLDAAPVPAPAAPAAGADEPRALSFAELKELIEQGKTDQIPNNRLIPNELSKDAPSVSSAPPRKKPWEA